MKKTINYIFEAAELGGFTIKEIYANKSGIKVTIEKDYIFSECYFEPKNTEIESYLTTMMNKHNRAIGINLNPF